MKLFFYLFLVIIIFIGTFCNENVKIVDSSHPSEGLGKLDFVFSKAPSSIVQIVAKLSRRGFEDRILNFSITDTSQSASGTFRDIPVGQWHLKVDALDSLDIIRYSGEIDVNVTSDKTPVVELELLPTNGTIEFHITWGKPCSPVSSDIVSWWTGEGNTDDIVGGNNGTIQNGVSYSAGKVRKAFHFDGVGGRIVVPDADNLKFTGSFTIEGWIYIESWPGPNGGHILFRGDDRIGIDPYDIRILSDHRLQFLIEQSSEASVHMETPITLNRFLHVAASLDSISSAMRIYINGSVAAETTTNVRPFRDLDSNYSPGIGIGNTQGVGFAHNAPFHGWIDELAIYKKALSISEIMAIYQAGYSGKCRK